MTPTHYLHIGRNKSASTTLQYFFLNNAQMLASQGIDYFLFGALADSFPTMPGLRSHAEYAERIAKKPNRSTLVSNEDLMAFGRVHADPFITPLGDAPRRVIAYIREYPAWVRSSYMETTMTGRTTVDFDTFFRQVELIVSAVHALEVWAKRAGWENMHVRSLDPACLHNGDVLQDCTHVMGLSESLVRDALPEPKHVSPHWICVEIIRALRAGHANADWRSFTKDVIYVVRPLIEQAIAEQGAEGLKAHYLTAEQTNYLNGIYNSDIAKLNDLMGVRLPSAPEKKLVERAFSPSLATVPPEVLSAFKRLADNKEFRQANPAARAAVRGAFNWVRH